MRTLSDFGNGVGLPAQDPRPHVLGVPFIWGQPHREVGHAPRLLREQGLFSGLAGAVDLGDLEFEHDSREFIPSYGRLISEHIEAHARSTSPLVILGGDHGLGLGTVHGILSARPDSIVVWLDAHADMNTPSTSRSQNFHGMPLSFLLPFAEQTPGFEWVRRKLRPERLILVGTRDVDAAEADFITRWGIQLISAQTIREHGVRGPLRDALALADPTHRAPIHLSFDVDALDPANFSATGTRVPEGVAPSEAQLLATQLARTGRLKSFDVVEFAPKLTPDRHDLDCARWVNEFIQQTAQEISRAR